jgi:ATP-dependent exoDNAse (exonuclease V) alpha subunit
MPSHAKFTVTGRSGKPYRIQRSQYAMMAGYAFTDYKSQGQTIKNMIIDIGKPPTRSLSPFSVYVALSRSRGRDTIRLLRDFDPNLF